MKSAASPSNKRLPPLDNSVLSQSGLIDFQLESKDECSKFPVLAPNVPFEAIWPTGVQPQLLERVLSLLCYLNCWNYKATGFSLQKTIEEKICEVLHAERANLYLFEPGGETMVLQTADVSNRISFTIGKGIVGAVGATLEMANLVEAYNHPSFDLAVDQYPPSASPCVTMLCVPIRTATGEAIGVMQVVNKRTGTKFNKQDEVIAMIFGMQAAVLYLANTGGDSSKGNQKTETSAISKSDAAELLNYSNQLFGCSTTDKLLLLVGYQAPRLIPSGHGTLFLCDSEQENLWTLRGTTVDLKKLSFKITKDTTAGWVAIHGEALNVSDVYQDGRFNANIDTKSLQHRECNILCVPVRRKVDGKMMGVIEIVKKAKNAEYHGHDIALLSSYADQVALALLQTQNADENVLVSRQCRSLSAHLQFSQALAACRASLCATLRSATARIHLMHPNGKVLCLTQGKAGGEDAYEQDGIWTALGKGIVGIVGKTMQMINVPNAYAEPLFSPDLDIQFDMKTKNMLCFPLLRRNGALLGVVEVINKVADGATFNLLDEERAKVLAEQISRTLENCEKYSAAERSQRQGVVLGTAACELFNIYDVVALSKTCTQQLRQLVSTDNCALYLRDMKTDELWARVEGVRKEIRFAKGQGVVGAVAASGVSEYIKDATADARLQKNSDILNGLNARTMLIAPLIGISDEVVGVVQLLDRKPDAYTEEDQQLLSQYFRIVATAIENCNLFARKLSQVQSGVAMTQGRHVAYTTLSKSITTLIGAEQTFLYVVEHDRGALVYYGDAQGPKVFSIQDGMAGFVASSGKLAKTDNVQLDPAFNPTVDQLGDFETKSCIVVPLRDSQGVVSGVLSVQNKRKGIFTKDDVAVLQGLSTQHGELIKSCEELETLRRRTMCVQTLLVEAHSLLRMPSLKDLLYHAGLMAQRALMVEHCSVFSYNAETGEMVAVHLDDNDGDVKEIRFAVSDDTVAGCVCRCKTIINLPDVHADERFSSAVTDNDTPCSMLCVPIFANNGEDVIGVVEVINSMFGPFIEFRKEEEAMLQLFSGLVSTALNNIYFHDRTLRMIRMTTYFQQMSTSMSPRKVRKSVCDAIQDAVDCEHVFLLDADPSSRSLIHQNGDDTLTVSFGTTAAGIAAESAMPVRLVDAHKDPMFDRKMDMHTKTKTHTLLAVPILDDCNQIQAVVQAVNKKDGSFTGEDESFVKVLSIQAGIMLKNSKQANAGKKAQEKRVLVARIFREIHSDPSLKNMMLVVETQAKKLLDVRKSQLYLIENLGTQKMVWTMKDGSIGSAALGSYSTSVLGQALLSCQMQLEEPKETSEHAGSQDPSLAFRANILCIPLSYRLGVIEAAGKRSKPFDDEDIFQLNLLADTIGHLIHHLKLMQTLSSMHEVQSPKDPEQEN